MELRLRKRASSHIPTPQPRQPSQPTEELIRILQTPTSLRTSGDLSLLVDFLQSSETMREAQAELTPSITQLVALKATYRLFEADERVDESDLQDFCVIIEGAAYLRRDYGGLGISSGDSFGTLRLGEWKKRDGVVRFREDCHCVVLRDSELPYITQQLKSALYKFLRSIPVFSRVAHAALTQLIAKAHTLRLTQNNILYHTGDRVTDVYVVRDGEVKLTEEVVVQQRGTNAGYLLDRRGRTIRLETILGPGELVGEEMTEMNSTRKHTCYCRSPVAFLVRIPIQEVWAVDSRELWEEINHRSEVKQALRHKRQATLSNPASETNSNKSESPQRSPDRSCESRSFSKFEDINTKNPLLKAMLEQIVAHEPSFEYSPTSALNPRKRSPNVSSLRAKRSANSSLDYSNMKTKSLTRISGNTGVKRNALSIHDVRLKRMLTNGQKGLAHPVVSADSSMLSDAYPLPRPRANLPMRASAKLARRNLLKGLAV